MQRLAGIPRRKAQIGANLKLEEEVNVKFVDVCLVFEAVVMVVVVAVSEQRRAQDFVSMVKVENKTIVTTKIDIQGKKHRDGVP